MRFYRVEVSNPIKFRDSVEIENVFVFDINS